MDTIWICGPVSISLRILNTTIGMSKLERNCTDFVLTIKNTDDLQACVNAEMAIRKREYERGYQDCVNDRRKITGALRHAAEKAFQEDLEVIDDVMSSPFDIEHQ